MTNGKTTQKLRDDLVDLCQRWQGELDLLDSLNKGNYTSNRIAHAHITICLNDLKNTLEGTND